MYAFLNSLLFMSACMTLWMRVLFMYQNMCITLKIQLLHFSQISWLLSLVKVVKWFRVYDHSEVLCVCLQRGFVWSVHRFCVMCTQVLCVLLQGWVCMVVSGFCVYDNTRLWCVCDCIGRWMCYWSRFYVCMLAQEFCVHTVAQRFCVYDCVKFLHVCFCMGFNVYAFTECVYIIVQFF